MGLSISWLALAGMAGLVVFVLAILVLVVVLAFGNKKHS